MGFNSGFKGLKWTINNIPIHGFWSDQLCGIKRQSMQNDHKIHTKSFLMGFLKLKRLVKNIWA